MIIPLLSRFMLGKVTADEYARMKLKINHSSDEQLQSVLHSLWEDETAVYTMPVSEKIQVFETLHKRINRKSILLPFFRTAVAVLIPMLLMWATYRYASDHAHIGRNVVVMADAGQKTHLFLSDGTKVWINSESSISYAPNFGVNNRTVRLKGEAYFEVTKNKKHKFVVETDVVNVLVHGTRFNVSAHPHSSVIDVSLIEGSVEIESKKHEQLALLSPNHTIHINKKDMEWSILSENTEDISLWRLNKWRFEGATAAEVFKKLEYWYGLKIEIEHINTQYRYSFTIKNESIRELLELINELTPLEYKIDGEEVNVRYK